MQLSQPFTPTHRRRKDRLAAMLLADRDGTALYRVSYPAGRRRTIDKITVTSSARFARNFVEVA